MDVLEIYKKSKKVHFVGIGGVSMSALAKHALMDGKIISGSDIANSVAIRQLIEKGVTVYNVHDENNLDNVDAVVVTSAIKDDNSEIVFAKRKGLPIIKRSELLNALMKGYKKRVAVSGCHGKTTTTAMIGEILKEANLFPTVFLGGEYGKDENLCIGKGEFVVAEACEYKKNLLDIESDISVVLNVGNDHMDCYSDMNDLVSTFRQFTQAGVSVMNGDDEYFDSICGVSTISFGINSCANYKAERLKNNEKGYSFTVYAYSRKRERINLKIKGKHNVYNALASYAVCDLLGVPSFVIKKSLEKFSGVKRRNEYIGKINSARVFADYAHHPKEIQSTMDIYAEHGKKLVVVFQPHTYSRTKNLMKDFVQTLKDIDKLYVLDTYSAREEFDNEGSAKTLSENVNASGGKSVFVKDETELKEVLKDDLNESVEVILFLGAGDIYDISKSIVGAE